MKESHGRNWQRGDDSAARDCGEGGGCGEAAWKQDGAAVLCTDGLIRLEGTIISWTGAAFKLQASVSQSSFK